MGKAIGRHVKRIEPSLSLAPRPNLYPGSPSEDQKAIWLVSQAAAPQGEATQAFFITLGLELPAEEHASQMAQEEKGGTRSKGIRGCGIYHPDQPPGSD